MSRTPLISPAAYALNRRGVSVCELARLLDVSASLVSYQLRGLRRPHPALIPVIRSTAGPDAALEIEAILDAQETSDAA